MKTRFVKLLVVLLAFNGLTVFVNTLHAEVLNYKQLREGAKLLDEYEAYVASDGMTYRVGDTLRFEEPVTGVCRRYSYIFSPDNYEAYRNGTASEIKGIKSCKGEWTLVGMGGIIKTIQVHYTNANVPYVIATDDVDNVIIFEDALQYHEISGYFHPVIHYCGYFLNGSLLNFKTIANKLGYKQKEATKGYILYSGSFASIKNCQIILELGNYVSYNNVYVRLPKRNNQKQLLKDYNHVVSICTEECGLPNKVVKDKNVTYWDDGVTALYVMIPDNKNILLNYQSKYGYEIEQNLKLRRNLVKSLKNRQYTNADKISRRIETFTNYTPDDGELTFDDVFAYVEYIHTFEKQTKHQRNILKYIAKMMSYKGNEFFKQKEYEQAQIRFKLALQIWLFVYGEIPSANPYNNYEERVEELSQQLDESFPIWSLEYYEMLIRIEEVLPPSTPSKSSIKPSKNVVDSIWQQVDNFFL